MTAIETNPFRPRTASPQGEWTAGLGRIPGPASSPFPFVAPLVPDPAADGAQSDASASPNHAPEPQPFLDVERELGDRRRYREAIDALGRASQLLRTNMREQAVSLGMTIAEVMVRRALDLDPGLVVDAVDSAIAELGAGDGQSPTVRMCPSDLERLAELEDIQFPPDGVTTLPDESLEPGDCVAELDGYLADARLTPRLAAIRAHLDTTSAGDS